MHDESDESVDTSKKDDPPQSTSPFLSWWEFLVASVVLLVVLVAAGVVTIRYGPHLNFVDDTSPIECPPVRTDTGIQSPGVTNPQKNSLSVADAGFAPYEVDGEYGVERATFGAVVKNETDRVLYNGAIAFELVDADGNDPTDGLDMSDQHDNDQQLESQIPVLFPGQKIGLGGDLITRTDSAEDPESGKPFKQGPVDYDALDLKIIGAGGEWWQPENDEYRFTKLKSSKGEPTKNIPGQDPDEFTFADGETGTQPNIDYKVKSPECESVRALPSSAVAYGPDGKPIGGIASQGVGTTTDLNDYAPGSNSGDPIDFLYPGTDVTIEVFPYAEPIQGFPG